MVFKIEECMYTKQYCEENIYMLCKKVEEMDPEQIYYYNVAYIINPEKKVPIWKQKACKGDDPVIWDYHVIMLYNEGNDDLSVYDFDSTLPFPCDAKRYFMEAFKPQHKLREEYERCFRVIPAHLYLENFSSDRSHMQRKDGTYIAPPPPYEPIVSEKKMKTFLEDFLSVEYDPYYPYSFGRILNSRDFYEMANLVYDENSEEESRAIQGIRSRLSNKAKYWIP